MLSRSRVRPAQGCCVAPYPAWTGRCRRRSTRARPARGRCSWAFPASTWTAAASPPRRWPPGPGACSIGPDACRRAHSRLTARSRRRRSAGRRRSAAGAAAARDRLAPTARREGDRRDRLDRQDLDQGPAARRALAIPADGRLAGQLQHRDRAAAARSSRRPPGPRCWSWRWACAAPARSPSSRASPSPTSA